MRVFLYSVSIVLSVVCLLLMSCLDSEGPRSEIVGDLMEDDATAEIVQQSLVAPEPVPPSGDQADSFWPASAVCHVCWGQETRDDYVWRGPIEVRNLHTSQDTAFCCGIPQPMSVNDYNIDVEPDHIKRITIVARCHNNAGGDNDEYEWMLYGRRPDDEVDVYLEYRLLNRLLECRGELVYSDISVDLYYDYHFLGLRVDIPRVEDEEGVLVGFYVEYESDPFYC